MVERLQQPDLTCLDGLLAEAQARADEVRRDRPVREAPDKPAKGSTESITANGFDKPMFALELR